MRSARDSASQLTPPPPSQLPSPPPPAYPLHPTSRTLAIADHGAIPARKVPGKNPRKTDSDQRSNRGNAAQIGATPRPRSAAAGSGRHFLVFRPLPHGKETGHLELYRLLVFHAERPEVPYFSHNREAHANLTPIFNSALRDPLKGLIRPGQEVEAEGPKQPTRRLRKPKVPDHVFASFGD
jgi:hypothetical protein